uniref:Uncharacterized protein n=1 Tax=Spongospora subterranea TaxID=70186 RepID=A0A0H5R705_9EUKA|eukprot:CRZ09611.1 hypothetical protein [Spongospora subterranea]
MSFSNMPDLTRFVNDWQKTQKRMMTLEVEIGLERQKRIQAEAAYMALKAEVAGHRPHVDYLGLFVNNVLLFADEMKNMAQNMYSVHPLDVIPEFKDGPAPTISAADGVISESPQAVSAGNGPPSPPVQNQVDNGFNSPIEDDMQDFEQEIQWRPIHELKSPFTDGRLNNVNDESPIAIKSTSLESENIKNSSTSPERIATSSDKGSLSSSKIPIERYAVFPATPSSNGMITPNARSDIGPSASSSLLTVPVNANANCTVSQNLSFYPAVRGPTPSNVIVRSGTTLTASPVPSSSVPHPMSIRSSSPIHPVAPHVVSSSALSRSVNPSNSDGSPFSTSISPSFSQVARDALIPSDCAAPPHADSSAPPASTSCYTSPMARTPPSSILTPKSTFLANSQKKDAVVEPVAELPCVISSRDSSPEDGALPMDVDPPESSPVHRTSGDHHRPTAVATCVPISDSTVSLSKNSFKSDRDFSMYSLENEILAMLATRSSSTCCDVKTLPAMYEARYGCNFSKRLVQAGLSTLDTFVNFFKWQSHLQKTSLIFTEKVTGSYNGLFVSVALPSSRSSSTRRNSPTCHDRSEHRSSQRSRSRSPSRRAYRPLLPTDHYSSSRRNSRDAYDYSRRDRRDDVRRSDSLPATESAGPIRFCYQFNRTQSCRSEKCSSSHVCALCGSGGHGVVACPVARDDSEVAAALTSLSPEESTSNAVPRNQNIPSNIKLRN